jgi:N-acetyl-anhydromuramyl-L-alanine amidase AmpD
MTRFLAHSAFRLLLLVAALSFALGSSFVSSTQAQEKAPKDLSAAFQHAAKEFDVPRDLLVALAYAETHFDDHNGQPSIDNGYGVMHLVDNPRVRTLKRAAMLLGSSEVALKTDSAQNIRGGAALLRFYADEQRLDDLARKDLAQWYAVVARYSNAADPAVAKLYADEVYGILNTGLDAPSRHDEPVTIPAQPVKPHTGTYEDLATIQSTDYSPALWLPAYSGNYAVANRETDYPIDYVFIHTTQGSYASTLSWFQDPASGVSTHYVIRASDGQVTQMVREKDVGYHVWYWAYNSRSIGIEHEGYVDASGWYTDAMYKASAALTRNICLKYGIPMDRAHILAHSEVPGGTSHTDPGPYWDWNYYMSLVKQEYPWTTLVDNATSATFTASSNWIGSSTNTQRYGSSYRYASPQPVTDTAWFKMSIPANSYYEILVWYPASTSFNTSTPFVIATASGNQFVRVNQQINGGKWVSLGTFALNAGTYNAVGVSRWSAGTGYVIADAVKLVQR